MNEKPTNKKIIRWGELQERLEAGDPEVTELWGTFLIDFLPKLNILAGWYQKKKDNPLTGALIDRLTYLTESADPYFRTIGKNIDIECFVEMMNNVPNEVRKFQLPENISYKTVSDKAFSGYHGVTVEIPVEWDILAAASDSCLKGRVSGFYEKEIIGRTPASVTWRLWTNDLGEYGSFEVRKIRAGWSQVSFSGLRSIIGLSTEQREAKEKKMKNIIELYFFWLSQESIYPEDAIAIDTNDMTQSMSQGSDLPPIYSDEMKKVAELSKQPLTISQIATRLCLSTSTVKRYRKELGIRRRKK